MKKKGLWLVGALCLVAALAAYFAFRSGAPAAPDGRARGRAADGAGRPMPVAIAEVRRGDIEVTINALGTVTARNTVIVKPRIDGQLVRIAFQEGQMVKTGDVLAEIDPRALQAQADQAQGQLERDQALLANAQLDLERYRKLAAEDSIARQTVDAQEALVRQYKGTVQTDRGALDNARLQLTFTRVTAPAAGRLGLRQVDVGNMVSASDSGGLVVITQTQPITAVFSISSENLGPVVQRLRAGESLQLEAWDREGRNRLATGKVLSLDNQIDPTTGTVKVKGEFANLDNALFPNQFINARLRVETRRGATLIPAAAVQRGAPGTFVYVVNADQKTVSTRVITLGPGTADVVAIENGLTPGEQVVVDGTDKLRQGARIEVPAADAAPGEPGRAPAAGEERRGKGKRNPAAADGAAAKPAEATAPAGKSGE